MYVSCLFSACLRYCRCTVTSEIHQNPIQSTSVPWKCNTIHTSSVCATVVQSCNALGVSCPPSDADGRSGCDGRQGCQIVVFVPSFITRLKRQADDYKLRKKCSYIHYIYYPALSCFFSSLIINRTSAKELWSIWQHELKARKWKRRNVSITSRS